MEYWSNGKAGLATLHYSSTALLQNRTETRGNMKLGELRKRRELAAHRRRRVIFNNDGNTIMYRLGDDDISREALLADRTTPLLGTHVDSIFYCTSAGLGMSTHMSEVSEPFISREGVFEANQTRAFHEAGLDPLEIMVDFCRANEIEVFWSMRMNDIHDSYPLWHMLGSQFKKDNPQLLFGSLAEPPAFGFWSGAAYDEAEVREKAFRMQEDVCKRYDVDGIEMDWMRHPPHFRCNADGEDCTQAERDVMTDFHRRIREMTEQIGLERGRPILVAVRIPASVSCCEAIGLDVTRWLEEGLVDLLIPGEWELAPWDGLVALGHRHGVPVYPCLSWSGSKRREGPPGTQDGLPTRHFRSRVMNVWHSGADGVYTFNYFDLVANRPGMRGQKRRKDDPESSGWREMGDPDFLTRLDKDYLPDGHFRFLIGREVRDLLRFLELPTALDPEIPQKLEPTRPFTVKMTIGEDPSAHGPESRPEVTLSVQAEGMTTADGVEVRLNDRDVSGASLNGEWVSYGIEPERIRKGANTVRVINRDPSNKGIVLKNVHVRIAHPGNNDNG